MDEVQIKIETVTTDSDPSVSPQAINVPKTPTYFPYTDVKIENERQHIYELFQPWALQTYGDQAKTKTITLRKKVRILKALEGKEHSRPDSSKFRFWVKSKGFTTKYPDNYLATNTQNSSELPADAVLSDNPKRVDLFVASRNKENGNKIYRKVAVVEEFFDIIYNVHMELGGRSGMHAGQKRTYRIITESYAFLPREAVTRFLSICPECKKNLRPTSPSTSSCKLETQNTEISFETDTYNESNTNVDEKLSTSTPKRSALTPNINITSNFLKSIELTNLPTNTSNTLGFQSQANLLRFYELYRHFLNTNLELPTTSKQTVKRPSEELLIPSAKKLKCNEDLEANFSNLVTNTNTNTTTTTTTTSVLNLSKQLYSRSQVLNVVAAAPKDIKPETTSTTLNLESLKPITTTYLQLTRSMGLTDEDALRFDNLVSKDFKYSL